VTAHRICVNGIKKYLKKEFVKMNVIGAIIAGLAGTLVMSMVMAEYGYGSSPTNGYAQDGHRWYAGYDV
jgi:uncharacterized membrane-anchored protein